MQGLKRFASFAVAGGIGFVIDFGVLMLALKLGFGPWLARALSFTLAVAATYLINATYTFQARHGIGPRSFGLYLSASFGGLALNVAIYAGLVVVGLHPAPALVVASAGAMAFNYLSYSRIF